MEELFKEIAGRIALGVEAIAALVIACGAADAVVGLFRPKRDPARPLAGKKEVWLRFGVWLLLGLEFELAADIVRTAIAPTWGQIGQLASIAVIRTFLNYFLERDIEKSAESSATVARAAGGEAAASRP